MQVKLTDQVTIYGEVRDAGSEVDVTESEAEWIIANGYGIETSTGTGERSRRRRPQPTSETIDNG